MGGNDVTDVEESSDFTLPLDKAVVERPGTDVTICAFSRMVDVSLKAAEELAAQHGISVEVSVLAVCVLHVWWV